jgi:protein-disulfide isomerase
MSTSSTTNLVLPVGTRDHVRGPETALVTMVEYGDFECPYCGEAYPVLEEVVRSLGDKLRFLFRHFPLTQIHPHAQHAAEAAETAASHHKFWEMHGMLFTHQIALDDQALTTYASTIGLEPKAFIRDLDSHRHAARVQEDFLSGVKSGVNGTPTLFINDTRFDGPPDYDSLLEAIEYAAQEK